MPPNDRQTSCPAETSPASNTTVPSVLTTRSGIGGAS
jgi:hypothetical protein